MDGNAHHSRQLPVLLAGGGGTLRGGRCLDYSQEKTATSAGCTSPLWSAWTSGWSGSATQTRL